MVRLLIIASLALFSISAAYECFSGCRFKFCDHKHEFWMPYANRPFTGPICYKHKDISVGIVGESGEALLVHYKDHPYFTPISKWRPDGLKQDFTPSFFKTFSLRNPYGRYYHYLKHSGVGREDYQQNQRRFLNKKCFILPLKNWQELDKFGNVVDNVHSDDWLDCVAFRTRTYYK